MKRFFFGFLTGSVVTVLLAVIVIWAVIRFGEHKVVVPTAATLVLHLEGAVPEQAPVELPYPFQDATEAPTMLETWQLLRKAAADQRIKALVIEPRDLHTGWAKLEELHDDILNFKKSGKPVFAYLRGAGTHEYYVASAADQVFMAPEDELDVKGLKAELMFVKGTLDKLGVQMEFQHVGKYKDAPDMFTRTSSTPETREVINQILDQYFGDFVTTVAQGRKKSADQIRASLDDGPFIGKSAQDAGFVDALLFEDEMYDRLKNQLKQTEIKRISGTDYATIPAADLGLEGKAKIAIITGDGEITRGNPRDSDSGQGITASAMTKQIREVANDKNIRGAILRIDSPGGDGIASDDILHEVKMLSQKKPLVISMSDLAASGGYFIAMSGDPVLAYPNTETGSIGVFFGKINLRALYDKIGIQKELFTRGKNAAIDTDYGALSDDQRARLQQELETFYRGFVERVSAGRKRPYAEVEPLAQGRVWLGVQAKQNGLIDELGGLDRALELVKQRANIGAAEKVTLVTYPPRRSWWDLVFNRSDDTTQIESRVKGLLGNLPIRSLMQGGILRLRPYTIDVR